MLEEGQLDRRQARLDDALVEHARTEPEAHEPLVQILPRPGQQARVDRAVEGDEQLRDAARGGDDHDHHHLRLKRQHLDVPDRRRVQRRRGDDRQQVGHLRQGLRGRTHRLVHLTADQRELHAPLRLEPPARREHPVDHVAVAGVRGHATGRDVGMGEQAELLEQRQFVSYGGRSAVELRIGGDRTARPPAGRSAGSSSTTLHRICSCLERERPASRRTPDVGRLVRRCARGDGWPGRREQCKASAADERT